jgi:hypothetical protein
MRNKFNYIILFALFAAAASSCKKDNYAPPSSTLSGKIVYKGEAIGVEYNQVPIQIYQYGFGLVAPINTSVAQDGSYSALLFDGDYKFIIPNGKGPFRWRYTSSGAPDSVAISMKGSQTMDMEVTPYYMIRTPQIAVAAGKVTGTFKAETIITDANAKNIERVNLYINKTQFVSGNADQNIGKAEIAGSAVTDPNNISMTVSVPSIVPTQNYVFARVGIKISGVENMILSPVVKLTF